MDNNVDNQNEMKEKIIATTIALIETSDALVENVTIRTIAKKANVSVGLINYHFGSKKELVEICVQRIISHVMKTFSQNEALETDEKPDLAAIVVKIFRYLIENQKISKISILGDLSQAGVENNSFVSYKTILKSISKEDEEVVRKIKAFMFLSTIQSAFLNKEISKDLFGLDLNNPKEHYPFFQKIIDILKIS